MMTSEETMDLLSFVRLGIHLGLLEDITIPTVNELFLNTQPAHLQKLTGNHLDGEERNAARRGICAAGCGGLGRIRINSTFRSGQCSDPFAGGAIVGFLALCVGLRTPYHGTVIASEVVKYHPNVVCGLPTTCTDTSTSWRLDSARIESYPVKVVRRPQTRHGVVDFANQT